MTRQRSAAAGCGHRARRRSLGSGRRVRRDVTAAPWRGARRARPVGRQRPPGPRCRRGPPGRRQNRRSAAGSFHGPTASAPRWLLQSLGVRSAAGRPAAQRGRPRVRSSQSLVVIPAGPLTPAHLAVVFDGLAGVGRRPALVAVGPRVAQRGGDVGRALDGAVIGDGIVTAVGAGDRRRRTATAVVVSEGMGDRHLSLTSPAGSPAGTSCARRDSCRCWQNTRT